MSSFFTEASVLIVQVVFGLYILAVLLRFLFQLVRADFYNPISQFLVALTNPLLKPLRRVIPGLFGVDLASLVLLIALQMLEMYVLTWLNDMTPGLLSLTVATVVSLARLVINVYFYAVLL